MSTLSLHVGTLDAQGGARKATIKRHANFTELENAFSLKFLLPPLWLSLLETDKSMNKNVVETLVLA